MWAPHQAPIRIKTSDVSLPHQTSAPGTVSAPENRQFPTMSKHRLLTDAMARSPTHHHRTRCIANLRRAVTVM